MRSLTPAQLKDLEHPRLCIWCEQEPAMLGQGSNYCVDCRSILNPALYPKWRNLR